MIDSLRDIEDNKFWKHIYVLLVALFSSLKALRLCDTNFSGMDKIYYQVHCACTAVAKSVALLNDETLFSQIAKERIEIMASEIDEVFCADKKCIGMIEL